MTKSIIMTKLRMTKSRIYYNMSSGIWIIYQKNNKILSGEPVRGPDGHCLRAAVGEEGEFVGRIVRGDPVKDFEGYRDRTATEKKILKNVFAEGDFYFRSGDIMVMDELGWFYFQDRAGDTFR